MHAPAVVISLFVRVTWGADFGAPSLLQHRVQGQRQALIDASDGHSARHAALAGFEKYASELTTNMLAHNLTMNETEKLAVETIIDFIDSMYEDLNIGHKEDEEEVETCKTQLDLCRNRVNVSEIEGWRSVVETQRNTHNRCRTAEKQFTIHKNQLCQEYEDYRMNQDAAVPPQCLGDYLIRDYVVTTNRDKLDKMEECMTQNRGWLLPMWDKYQKCTDPPPPPPPPTPTPPTPPPPRDCCPAQNEFEDSSCKYALYHDAQCNMFNVCWQQEVTECGAMCARVKISVEARKADNVTAQRIRCLLGVLTESNNTLKPGMLKECKDAAHPTSHWDLPCPNPAIPVPPNPPVPCTRLHRPCEDIWMDAEYKNKPWYGEHVSMCDCQQCARPPPPTIAPTPAPTPPPQVTPSPTENVSTFQQLRLCLHKNNSVCNLLNDIIVEKSSDGNRGEDQWGSNHPGLRLPLDSFATILGNGHTLDGQGKRQILNVERSTLTVYETIFNNARGGGSNGGAIAHRATDWPLHFSQHKFICIRCQFLKSYSCKGSAVYGYWGNLHFEDTLFHDNEAFGSGCGFGAICAWGTPLYCKNCKFLNNYGNWGGAIYTRGRDVPSVWDTMKTVTPGLTVRDVFGVDEIEGCIPVTLINCHFAGNEASKHQWNNKQHCGNDICDQSGLTTAVMAFGGVTAPTQCPGSSGPLETAALKGSGTHPPLDTAVNCADFDLDTSWVAA